MTRFSLVVATVHRTAELGTLLASFDIQTHRDFEVIVVDQNSDDRILPVLQQHPGLRILHLRSAPGVSLARNTGLGIACGDLIATPDDDCWYPPNLLRTIDEWFEANPGCDALFTGLRNEAGRPMLPKWAPHSGPCTKQDVWDCAMTATAFFRRQLVESLGGFSEQLGPGPGTAFKACEDIDYFIRALETGARLYYDPAFVVYHPDLSAPTRLRDKTYSYALAYGYVMRIHHYSLWYFLKRVLRSLGGAIYSLFKAEFERANLYLLRAAGQLRGYFWGPRDMARLRTGAD